MYCPRCSQQQTSYQVRYCPGCGLQLDSVIELLSNNGVPLTQQPESCRKVPRFGRKGVLIGGKVMFFALFLLPVAMVMSIGADSPGPLALPFITFLVGLAISLYTFLFGKDRPDFRNIQYSVASGKRRLDLPSPQINPIPAEYTRPVNTAEMMRPLSVTEHTTKLL